MEYSRVNNEQHQDGDDDDEILPISATNSRSSVSHSPVRNVVDGKYPKVNVKRETEPSLRYRRRSIYLLLLYIPLLVIPWTLTCVLSVRPLGYKSYINQKGGISADQILSIASWLAAVRVLNSINAVIAIPNVSTLLSQAAVVYVQRRKVEQKLTVRQTFALADRGWSNITILWESFGSNQSRTSSRFLWCAFFLLILSALQQPVQQLLVSYQLSILMTCLDEPIYACNPLASPTRLGYDPEPPDMALIPQNIVVQQVANDLATYNEMDHFPQLWPDNPYTDGDLIDSFARPYDRETIFWYSDSFRSYNRSFFATALPNGTTTGVLRQHAMRLNSSISCNHILSSEFPQTCPGLRPFTASYSLPNVLDISVCAPGEYGVHPWTLSRNRQDIAEELFIDVAVGIWSGNYLFNARYSVKNMTLHCTANTTRGYFELGNYRNNYSYTGLIEKWPEPDVMNNDFNDHMNSFERYINTNPGTNWSSTALALNRVPDPFGTYKQNASGPLMTSAIAMFGNTSFFYIASNSTNTTFPPAKSQICQQGKIPFSRMGLLQFDGFQSECYNIESEYSKKFDVGPDSLAGLLYQWVMGFNRTTSAEEALSASMFLANKAMLLKTVAATSFFSARSIFTAPGTVFPKPAISLAGKIVVSVFIFLQLLGLAFTTWYIYHVPTWAPSLDALAIARMGASLEKEDLPAIGPVAETDLAKLTKIDGLIGVVEDEHISPPDDSSVTALDDTSTEPPIPTKSSENGAEGKTSSTETIRLGLGAPGLISRNLAPKKEKQERWWRRLKKFFTEVPEVEKRAELQKLRSLPDV